MSPRRGFGRGGCPVTMGSRRWLPHAVPLGLKHLSPWRNRIAPRHHRIQPRHHRISSRRYRISPRSGDIAFSRNAATGCSHGRKPMDRGPSISAKSQRDDRTDESCRPVGASDGAVAPIPWAHAHGYHMSSRWD
jgi:hypothetical protein